MAQRGAGSAEGFAALAALADDWGIPVVQYWAIQLAIATDHPMSVGTNPEPWLSEADVVLVLDCLAPWSPAIHKLAPGCKVIQAGPDPLYSRFPVRNFQADVSLAGETADIILGVGARRCGRIGRRARMPARSARRGGGARRTASGGRTAPIGGTGRRGRVDDQGLGQPVPVAGDRGTRCDGAVRTGLPVGAADACGTAGSWYQEPHSGGLGWSVPCALGMQLARPERLIVATMGDGSYMFANPVACHQIAEALGLPVLLLVLNNREWGAVRQSVLGTYPDGYASRTNRMPLVSLDPTPDFTKVAAASRAWTARGGCGGGFAGGAGGRDRARDDAADTGAGGDPRGAGDDRSDCT